MKSLLLLVASLCCTCVLAAGDGQLVPGMLDTYWALKTRRTTAEMHISGNGTYAGVVHKFVGVVPAGQRYVQHGEVVFDMKTCSDVEGAQYCVVYDATKLPQTGERYFQVAPWYVTDSKTCRVVPGISLPDGKQFCQRYMLYSASN